MWGSGSHARARCSGWGICSLLRMGGHARERAADTPSHPTHPFAHPTQAFPVVPPSEPVCKSWVPEEEICRCSCRCICIYSPSGRVYWVPGEPPRVDPATLMSLDEAQAKGL